MDPIFNSLWALAQQASPFATALLLYVWYSERAERKEISKQALEFEKASNEEMKNFRQSVDRLCGAIRDLQLLIQTRGPR